MLLEDTATNLYHYKTDFPEESGLEDTQSVTETSEINSILGQPIDFTQDRLPSVKVLALASSDPMNGDTITPQGSPIIYVRPGAAGSGTSWADAYGDLQTAINNAAAGSEIWVAAGVYFPTLTGDRTISITLKDQIEIYGGFNGVETDRGQRNTAVNVTTLSGDIGVIGNNTDNSYHVVSAVDIPNNVILDGFTITRGNASKRNDADDGGGIFIRSSRVTFSNLFITDNSALDRGGGIFTNSVQAQLTNVVIQGNVATFGGAIFPDDRVTDDGITSNDLSIINSIIRQNTARSGGGGIRAFRTNVLIFGTVFDGNVSAIDGGGTYSTASTMTVINSTFINNVANGAPNPTNSESGGGGMSLGSGNALLTNNIFWGNQAALNSQIATRQPQGVTNSIVQGGFTGGISILDADPLLVDAASGNYALQAGSPAINRGNNASVPTNVLNDIVGNPRISGGAVDLGAYELFTFDAAQYGASNPDLIRGYGYNLAEFTNHYLTFGRFEGRPVDNFDEFRYIASSYVADGDLINAFRLDGAAATVHYITNGFTENRPLTAFVPSRYILSYPDDLLGAFNTDTLAATRHFITDGYFEQPRRDPDLFDAARYIASSYLNNGDLIKAYGYNLEAGSNHYLVNGRGENRSLSAFSPEAYLAVNVNDDVAGDPLYGTIGGATRHYIEWGFTEGRAVA